MLSFIVGAVAGSVLTVATVMTNKKIRTNKNNTNSKKHKPMQKRKLDLSTLTIDKLKEIARKADIKGYYSMTKRELIEAIEAVKKSTKKAAENIVEEVKKEIK